MRALLTRIAISAVANGVSLALAAAIFPGFRVTIGWFVAAVVVFTALTVALRGLVISTVRKYVRAYTIVGGLVLTAIALVITDALVPGHEGFDLDGVGTWIGVTLIVWAAGVAFGEVDQQAPPEAPPVIPRAR